MPLAVIKYWEENKPKGERVHLGFHGLRMHSISLGKWLAVYHLGTSWSYPKGENLS